MNRFFVLCLTTPMLVFAAAASDETGPRHVFEERYAAMKSAIARRDAEEISSLLAPGFVSTDIAGRTENAAQMIEELKKLPVDNQKTSKTTVRSVKINGNIAVVEQEYDMKTTKAAPDGTAQNIELVTVSEDKWINSKGSWLCQSTATNQIDYSINGKLVAHKTRTQ